MSDVLTELDQATPEWLTMILRQGAYLPPGQVVAAEPTPVNASSDVAHLRLRYSADAPADAPAHLFLKITWPGLEQRMPQRNKKEIAFYQALGDATGYPFLVRCYTADYVSGTGIGDDVDRFHLLLDDPSATTHVAYEHSHVPPTSEQRALILESLARLHAFWWDHPLLRQPQFDSMRGEQATRDLLVWAQQTLPASLDFLGDRIPPERARLYETVCAALFPKLLARLARGRHLTLTHGDIHVGNFLYPRDPARDGVYIIDWKGVEVTLGASDLAYMMALMWFPQLRQRVERDLLRRYHALLQEQGVTGYSWDDLWNDYRLMVMRHFCTAMWGWSVRQNSGIWWNHLERITLAIQDLDCLELLDL